MAIFQLEIADTDVARVFDAVCANYGWSANISNPEYIVDESDPENPIFPVDLAGALIPETIPNTETQGDFTHRMVRSFLSEHVKGYEIKKARDEAITNINTDVVINDPQP